MSDAAPVLVVGSIAFDTVETPYGRAEDVLGGSAVYFSAACALNAPVRLVGVVGEDFPRDRLDFLTKRGVDLAGLEVTDGDTFRWHGKYVGDMNDAETLDVHLNVFGEFDPKVPDDWRDTRLVFLANGAPAVQMKTLEQVEGARLTVADSMNLWIDTARDDLMALLQRVDGLVLNDAEAIMLTDADNLVQAGARILDLGPSFCVVKKGEHGATLFHGERRASLPGWPLHDVMDPTGAGDSFAGGLMGSLARESDPMDWEALKRAVARGMVTASFTVEDFSLHRLQNLDAVALGERVTAYREMLTF